MSNDSRFKQKVANATARNRTRILSGSATTYHSASFLTALSGAVTQFHSPILIPVASASALPRPNEGTGSLYVKGTDNNLYFQDDAGNEFDLTSGGGGGGTPAGSNTQIQFNNAGSFGASSNLTFDGTDLGVSAKIFHVGDTDTFINFTDDDINIQAGGVNFLDFTQDTQNDVTFNEAGVDIDFRIESADESHMFFMEASSNRISIGDSTDSPLSTLEVTNNSSDSVPLVMLNNNVVGRVALDINAANETANVVDIDADALTGNNVISVSANALTTGGILDLVSNSAQTNARSLVKITNDNTAATNTTLLHLVNDSTSATADVLIESTDADAAAAPKMHFLRNSASPSSSDVLGKLLFSGKDDAGNTTLYASMRAEINDETNSGGEEDGVIIFEIIKNANQKSALELKNNEAVFNNSGQDIDFRIETDDVSGFVFIDGNTNSMSIGSGSLPVANGFPSPQGTLEITNKAASAPFGIPLLQLNNNDVDQIALDINAANTTAVAIDIDASNTTAHVMDITADALTTGGAINITSNSSNTGDARSLIKVFQDDTSAGQVHLLHLKNDAQPDVFGEATALIEHAGGGNGLELRFTGTNTGKENSLVLSRTDTTSEADDMNLGLIAFDGANDNNDMHRYIQILGEASDVSDGDEGGKLTFSVATTGATSSASALQELLTIGGEDTTNGTNTSVVVNEAGIKSHFRVESNNVQNMFFVNGTKNGIGIGTNDPDIARVQIVGSSDGSTHTHDAQGAHLVHINQNYSTHAGSALVVTGVLDTVDLTKFIGDSLTSGDLLNASADALTTGSILNLVSNSSSNSTRSLVKIHNDHTSAGEATPLEIVNDGGGKGIKITASGSDDDPTLDITSSTGDGKAVVKIVPTSLRSDGYAFLIESDEDDNSIRSIAKIHNDHANATGATCLELLNDAAGTRQDVLISTATTTGDVFDINCNSLTTGNAIDISANGLTTGGILKLVSDSADTSSRTLVTVKNDNTAATGAVVMHLVNDAIGGDGDPILMVESTAQETHAIVEIKNSNATANVEPILKFNRSSTTGETDHANIGAIKFNAVNSANADETYASIVVETEDITNGSEDASMIFGIYNAGVFQNAFEISGEKGVVINEDSKDADFRVETNLDTHFLFVDGGNNRMSIGGNTGTPLALLEVFNGSADAETLVLLDNNDADQICLDINASNTTAVAIDIDASNTTANVMDIQANGLTSGAALNINSNHDDTTSRDLVKIHNDNVDATGACALRIINDATPAGVGGGAGAEAATVVIEDSCASQAFTLALVNNGDASNAPKIAFQRNTTSESDDMHLGLLRFKANNSADAMTNYATIFVNATDITDGDEGASIQFLCSANGASASHQQRQLLSLGGEDVANGVVPEVVVNGEGINCDFRVESATEDEAIFLDASAEELHINKGTSDFTTQIHSTNAVALSVTAAGVVFNEAANAENDFRVETANNTSMFFVDGENDTVSVGGSAPNNHKGGFAVLDDLHSTTMGGLAAGEYHSGKVLRYSPGSSSSLTAGQVFYLKASNSTWTQADAATQSNANGTNQLLCLGLGGNPQTVGVLLEGVMRVAAGELNGTFAVGAPVYISDTTAGHITFTAPASSGDFIRVIGFGLEKDAGSGDCLIYFKPDNTHVVIA